MQRTAELAESRDEALRANAAKTRFLAAASHDLRQPMHAIGLMVGLLRERVAQPDLRLLADKAQRATSGMETLFGGLLDISKLDAGVVQARVEVFALQPLLEQLEHSYAPLATAKGLRLRLRPSRAVVRTDPALLQRILGNLLANAIRYTHAGAVLVGCRRRAEGLALQVLDTGIGIPVEQQAAVFEEFVRLNEPISGGRSQTGTGGGYGGSTSGDAADAGLGLGLAIVKRSAQMLGLPLRLVSSPGQGSLFEVLVPQVMSLRQISPSAAMDTAEADALRGAFIVVVDDDAVGREATVALLAQWGALVVWAASAQAALDECAGHLRAPDVIVTDLQLGRGDDGLALIHSLRAQAETPIPAILVTAELRAGQVLDAATQLLHKPAGAERLKRALLSAMAGSVVSIPHLGAAGDPAEPAST